MRACIDVYALVDLDTCPCVTTLRKAEFIDIICSVIITGRRVHCNGRVY